MTIPKDNIMSDTTKDAGIRQHDLSTSAGGRAYIAEFFETRLRRHDFGRYIAERLAADFACALAKYLSEQDAAQVQAEAETDTQRLDFMLANTAFTVKCNRDGSILQYQLMTQDEDENYHVLHDEHRFYNTEREAIDAAIDAPSTGDQS